MTIRPSAIKVYNLSRKCSQFGVKYFLIGSAAMTAFSTTLWLATIGRNTFDRDLFAALNVGITIVLAVTYGLGKTLTRNRKINADTFHPEQYALIKDELRRRGIRNTRRFITEHPDHGHYSQELSRELGILHAPAYRAIMYQFEALLYAEEADPARAKEILVNIIADRRITDQNEVRGLLRTLLRTENPLGAGAL